MDLRSLGDCASGVVAADPAFAKAWAGTRQVTDPRRVVIRYACGPRRAPAETSLERVDALAAAAKIVRILEVDPDALMATHLPAQDGVLAILLGTPLTAADGRGVALRTRVLAYVVEGLDALTLNLALGYWAAHPKSLRGQPA